MATPEIALDHLLLGVADLDDGVRWVEKLTGVQPTPGGSHPGAGTRNALIALGGRRYLEIIAPDPAQSTYAFPVDVRALSQPRLVSWAVATADLDQVLEIARESGYPAPGPYPGSRSKPDGKLLKWRLVRIQNTFDRDGIQPFPFFIEWAHDSLHPSADSPPGCELVSIEFRHPDAANLAEALGSFGVEAQPKQAAEAALVARLRTPKGETELR